MELYKTKFYRNPQVDPITDEALVIGSKRYHELAKAYGYPKIRSPVTSRMINIGQSAYMKLLKDYTNEALLIDLSTSLSFEAPEKAPNVTLTKNFVPSIPDDITIDISKQMKTYTKLQFANTSKKIHTLCNDEFTKILKYNLNYKTLSTSGTMISFIKYNTIYVLYQKDYKDKQIMQLFFTKERDTIIYCIKLLLYNYFNNGWVV